MLSRLAAASCRHLRQAGALVPRADATHARSLASQVLHAESEVEKAIAAKLAAGLPKATHIKVADTSGGCGSMYSLEVVAPEEFAGLSIVKQHQLVTGLIKADVATWHGFQLVTKAAA